MSMQYHLDDYLLQTSKVGNLSPVSTTLLSGLSKMRHHKLDLVLPFESSTGIILH
jgi:hypothetical protein